MTESQATKLVAMLFAAYPTHVGRLEAGAATHSMRVYREFLAKAEHGAGYAAVRQAMVSCKFLPSIAELREILVDEESGDAGGWEAAWSDVMAAVGRVGIYRSPSFEDPRTAYALSCIGWRQLCNSDEASLPTIRAQFRQAWEGAQGIATRRGLGAVAERVQRSSLAGMHDDAGKRLGASSVADAVKGLLEGGE